MFTYCREKVVTSFSSVTKKNSTKEMNDRIKFLRSIFPNEAASKIFQFDSHPTADMIRGIQKIPLQTYDPILVKQLELKGSYKVLRLDMKNKYFVICKARPKSSASFSRGSKRKPGDKFQGP